MTRKCTMEVVLGVANEPASSNLLNSSDSPPGVLVPHGVRVKTVEKLNSFKKIILSAVTPDQHCE